MPKDENILFLRNHNLKFLENDDENLRLVFLFLSQKRLMIESKVKLEVKTIGQEL